MSKRIINYRKIYETTNGSIPKDNNGRTYDIHHIDGNVENNDPKNLVALSIIEHYNVHYSQGDWGACQAILIRMNADHEQISEMARKSSLKRIEDGTHNFLDKDKAKINAQKRIKEGTHHFQCPGFQKKVQEKRVKEGTHTFLGGKVQRETNIRRIKEGTHHLCGPENNKKQLENGNHPAQKVYICPHCNKIGNGGGMIRFHFDKCKENKWLYL
jgi:hypothetical protein